jgi:DNA (cytosine-5)-methyltransferase 1
MGNKIKVASFFCGCGGSDLGILGGFKFLKDNYKPLPFEISYALDFDKYAIETYNANFEHPAVCDDIKNVNINAIEDFDLLLGGFPCQSFSTVNPNKDTNDDRANLYKELVKILKARQPKFFVCENVKGLVTLQKGEILKKVITEFESVGY